MAVSVTPTKAPPKKPTVSGGGSTNYGTNNGDGSYSFNDVNGNPVRYQSTSGTGNSNLGVALPFDPGPFPAFPTIGFEPIKQAPYRMIDPIQYAKQFGAANLAQMNTNFTQAGKFASTALDNELAGLQAFAPGAAALSRSETGNDNIFNQGQRTNQVNSVLPGARGRYDSIGNTLQSQRGRAETYASGRLTNDLLDRSLELGIRSSAADSATYSGIGPRSMAASKISDLQSAETRFGIAQYGENLLGTNINADEQLLREEQNLFLAPTAYSNTGSQIRATPEVGAGRLTYQGAGMINEATLLSPGSALQSVTQQEQFKTSLAQRTNEFNSTGKMSAAQFNAQGIFQSAVGGFQANAQYQSQQQAANQGMLNNVGSAMLTGIQADAFGGGVSTAQTAGTISSIAGAIGTGVAQLGGATDLVGSANIDTGAVGGTDVNTSPTEGTVSAAPSSAPVGDLQVPQTLQYTGTGVAEGSAPGAYKYQSAASIPSGYVPIGKNSDGSVSAASPADYRNDLERFSRYSGNPSSSQAVLAAAQADKGISSAAGLSYVPIEGFHAIASLGNGKTAYSLPSASGDGNVGLGTERLSAAGMALNQLGVDDPAIYSELIGAGAKLQSGEVIQALDQSFANGGESELLNTLMQQFEVPQNKFDTPEGMRTAMGMQRVSELWPSLSPAQRSAAVASMVPDIIHLKTGKDIRKQEIPGSSRAAGGTLTTGQAMDVTAGGRNGFALARNWGQLSALGASFGVKDPKAIAALTEATGFLGYGPQGAAVSIPPEYLAKVGATPAPALGVGAAVFSKADHVPRNYSVISNTPEGGVIAMPSNLKHTSTINGKGPSPLSFKNAELVSRREHPAQKMWGIAPTRKLVRGAAGGSAIAAAMNTAVKANPGLAGSMIAHSLFNRTLGKNGA